MVEEGESLPKQRYRKRSTKKKVFADHLSFVAELPNKPRRKSINFFASTNQSARDFLPIYLLENYFFSPLMQCLSKHKERKIGLRKFPSANPTDLSAKCGDLKCELC